MTDYMQALVGGDVIEVTAGNLAAVKAAVEAKDQAEEIVIGCRTWYIRDVSAAGGGGSMTIWPDGRGAICLAGDSLWGTWDESSRRLALDGGKGYLSADGTYSDE